MDILVIVERMHVDDRDNNKIRDTVSNENNCWYGLNKWRILYANVLMNAEIDACSNDRMPEPIALTMVYDISDLDIWSGMCDE